MRDMSVRRLVALLSAFLVSAALAAPDPNLVRNPGFETVQGGVARDWTVSGAADLDNEQFHSGAMGARLRHPAPATSAFSQKLPLGERAYTAAVWVKVQGVAGEGFRLRVRGANGQVLAETPPLTGEGPWRRVALDFNPGAAGATIELALVNASGTAWADDVIVGESAAVKPLLEEKADGPARRNLALHRPYTLSPVPNYAYCTDPGDTEQLTDGQYTAGYFWTQKSTVGWYLYSPQIVVDLGKVEPIEGIMVHCPGGGAAGVKFPQEIIYYVSDDNATFREVARLKPRGLKQDGKSWYTHRFLADGLKTRGRYVMAQINKGSSTVFADEMEIYAGEFDPAAATFAGPAMDRLEMAYAQYGLTPRTYTRGHFPETPHIPWHRPLAGGPVKAIVLCFSEDMRDVCEIAQRLDLDYTPVSHFAFYRDEPLGQLMQEQIERALPAAQVMLVGGFRWTAMPKPLLEKIRARVREGMGLVCVSSVADWLAPVKELLGAPESWDQGILDGVPLRLIPGHTPRKSYFQLGAHGEGRVAFFQPQLLARAAHSLTMDFTLGDLDDDANGPVEYSFVALNRLMLWAARREARVLSQLNATPETISVKAGATPTGGKLRVLVRDTFFDPLLTKEFPVSAAGGVFDLPSPPGANGAHAVDVWLLDPAGAVIDLASAAYTVAHPARIDTLKLDKPVYRPGETALAQLKVAGPAAGLRLQARIFDTNDRETAPAVELPLPASGEAALKLPLGRPLTLGARLYLSLLRGDQVIEKRFERLWIDQPESEDYAFCAWYGPGRQPAASYALRALRGAGVDTIVSLSTLPRAESCAWADIRHGPENVCRVYPQNKDDSRVRAPCLSDPAYRAQTGKAIDDRAASLRPFGVTEWSMGDESTLGRRDYCVSPSCLTAFREYLKKQYPTVQALNESWGANYATWEEVVPAPLTEVEKRDRFGPWLDHRRYMESLFAEFHDWCRELIVKRIPEARVGISGTPNVNAYSGHDWWKLMQGPLTHLSSYSGPQREIQRSFKRPGAFVTSFLGYDYKDSDEQRARYAPWDLVFHGSGGVNYYTIVSDTLNCPLIRPDMSVTRKAPWFFEEVRQLKSGYGRLFMSAEYRRDGVAVHYSPASIHAAQAAGLFRPNDPLRNFNTNLNSLCKVLSHCHVQFDFIHEEQMVAGKLAEYKALFLPWSSAISPREAEAIRRFAEGGGVVIADSFCGVRDDHGAPRPMLDDLFGVRQPLAPPELEPKDLSITAPDPPGPGMRALKKVPVASGASKLELAGGTPIAEVGGVPAFIARKVGRGSAFFLNASLCTYAEIWASGVDEEVIEESVASQNVTAPIRTLVKMLLNSADVTPGVLLMTRDGLETEIELARWSLGGEARLFGLVRSIKAGAVDAKDVLPCTVLFAAPMHVYEGRSGRYLGRVKQFTDPLPRGVARVYALLPYRVLRLSVAAPGAVARGATPTVSVRLETEGAPAAAHVLRMTVVDPLGREVPWYSRNLPVSAGRAETQVPFAVNDAPGAWALRFRDVATGVEAAHTLQLTAQ